MNARIHNLKKKNAFLERKKKDVLLTDTLDTNYLNVYTGAVPILLWRSNSLHYILMTPMNGKKFYILSIIRLENIIFHTRA